MGKKEQQITGISAEEREDLWDEVYVKEEGVILEFEPSTNTGKIRSLRDGGIYEIDSRELLRVKIELKQGDKVLFAPIGDADAQDFARVVRIIELN